MRNLTIVLSYQIFLYDLRGRSHLSQYPRAGVHPRLKRNHRIGQIQDAGGTGSRQINLHQHALDSHLQGLPRALQSHIHQLNHLQIDALPSSRKGHPQWTINHNCDYNLHKAVHRGYQRTVPTTKVQKLPVFHSQQRETHLHTFRWVPHPKIQGVYQSHRHHVRHTQPT